MAVTSISSNFLRVTDSYPVDGDTWLVYVINSDVNPHDVPVDAICMTTEPSTVIATASKGFKVAKKGKR